MMATTNMGGRTLRPAASPGMAAGMPGGMPSSCVTVRRGILKRGVSASAMMGARICIMLGLMTLNENTIGASAGSEVSAVDPLQMPSPGT